jgi:hypothetical protein
LSKEIDMRHILHFTIIAALIIAGCSSPKSLYKNGDLHGAVMTSIQKLRANSLNDKNKVVLEQAYNELNASEFGKIELLKKENNPANWERIMQLYQSIDYRQNMIKPHLPVYVKKEYRNLDIKIVNIDMQLTDAKNQSAQYLYSKAEGLLKTKGKNDAREAYYTYSKIYGIFADYKDISTKIKTAKAIGTNLVLLDYKNNSNMMLTKDFVNELMYISTASLQSEWAEVITKKDDRVIDNIVVINLRNIQVSPEQINQREFTESANIQDGYTLMYDSTGKVMKDNNGKEMNKPKYKMVYAMVKEMAQHKEGYMDGSFDIMTYNTSSLIHSEPMRVGLIFNNIASIFTGDKRALTDVTRANLNNRPLPFPSNDKMMFDGVQTIKSDLHKMFSLRKELIER